MSILKNWFLSETPKRDLTHLNNMIDSNIERTEDIKNLTLELEKKDAEINKQNNFINSILYSTPDIIYTYDLLRNQIIWTNEKMEEFLGYTTQEAVSMNGELLVTIMHPEDYERYTHFILNSYKNMVDGQVLTYEVRYRPKHSDEWRWFRAREIVFKRDSLNKPIEILGVTVDITESKLKEEELKLQNLALNGAANSILITDRYGSIIFANNAMLMHTGYTLQELIGNNPRILKSGKHDDTFYKEMWETLSSGDIWSGLITNKTKDNSLVDDKTTITPVKNGVINYYIAIKERV